MSVSPDSPPLKRARAGVKLWVAAVLLLGGLSGIAVERLIGPIEPAALVGPERLPGRSPGGARAGRLARTKAFSPAQASEAKETETAADALTAERPRRPVALRARPVDVIPPEDPFRPTRADPPAPQGAAAGRTDAGAPAGREQSGREEARVAVRPRPTRPVRERPAPPAVSVPEDLTVLGVIQGDPPLAVVRYGGQSLFLKIGDQVADTWRLEQINERSAVFQFGERRVEIPIKGGSSP